LEGTLVTGDSEHPSVLIVHKNREFRESLAEQLQQTGYLVLEARDAAEASRIVVCHSRRIHLLLADDTDDDRLMAAMLKPYRPDMDIIHISLNLELHSILTEVSKFLAWPALSFEDPESLRASRVAPRRKRNATE
jgi:DNA-binding NtrC family response regulator